MNRFQLTLLLFIVSIIAGIYCGVIYFQVLLDMLNLTADLKQNPDAAPQMILSLFTPSLIISFIVAILSSWIFRILAIIHVAGSEAIKGGEKAIWVIGLVLFGFITGIIYLVFAKQKRFDPVVEVKGDIL